MSTLKDTILPPIVEESIRELMQFVQDDIAQGTLQPDTAGSNLNEVTAWLDSLKDHLKEANIIQLTEARLHVYISKVIEVGRQRRKGFPDFNEGDFFAAAAIMYHSFGIWDKVPAAWIFGVMHGLSPLDTLDGYEEVLQLRTNRSITNDIKRLAEIDHILSHEQPPVEVNNQLATERTNLCSFLSDALIEILDENTQE